MSADGGRAFPGFLYTEGHGENRKNADGEWETFSPGMSLRDHFAAAALQGICSNHTLIDSFPTVGNLEEWAASKAYLLADAMLAERAKP